MARSKFVKKARKDNPAVKKGESYYWWKFRFGGKRYSKTPPTRSQLTQSEFLGQIYDLEDSISDRFSMDAEEITSDVVENAATELADELRTLSGEQEEKIDNMPEQLQDSSSGEILRERADGLEEWASAIEGIDFSPLDDADDRESMLDDIKSEIEDGNPSSW